MIGWPYSEGSARRGRPDKLDPVPGYGNGHRSPLRTSKTEKAKLKRSASPDTNPQDRTTS